jgi:tripartite-type tricarboxylate transporter receptor subunit TctC
MGTEDVPAWSTHGGLFGAKCGGIIDKKWGETMRSIGALTALTVVATAWTFQAFAQDQYPSRSVHLIVSFPPGGGIDAVARLFADKMSAIMGQPAVVENRGGAAGLIAGRFVANADPDGYTVLVASNSMIVAQLQNPKPGLNIEQDLQAVAIVAPQANVVVAAPDLPVKSMKDLVELSKSKNLTYASPGTGSIPQLLLEHLFSAMPDTKMTHVPFPGAAQALTATMASQTDSAVVTLPPAVPLVVSGKLKGIVVTTATRSAALPDVPTAAESGYPNLSSTVWTGIFVPANTPKAATARLEEAILKVAAMSDVRAKLGQLGFEQNSIGANQSQRDVSAEVKLWADVLKQAAKK